MFAGGARFRLSEIRGAMTDPPGSILRGTPLAVYYRSGARGASRVSGAPRGIQGR